MKKAERTRQLIIEKAAPIFNKKGIAGTAISDIMAATKLAKGGVYGNFDSKDEICMEAFLYLTKSLNAAITQTIEEHSTAKDKLFALLDFYRERLFKSNRGGCPILNFGTEADDTNPLINQKVKDSINVAQSRISFLVIEGIKKGEFLRTFDPNMFAVKMFAMIEGAILIARVQNSAGQLILVTDMLKAEIEQNMI
jgi:TetR/AcrR family transcriptional regulator, transcriptional repressor for nem operon